MTTKKCSRCKQEKEAEAFSISRQDRSGLQSWCRLCVRESYAERMKDPVYAAKKQQSNKDWRKKNKARDDATTRAWQRAHPEQMYIYARRWNLSKHYGMTFEDYDRMLEAQGGGCAICGVKEDRVHTRRALAVDHDHETGKVRGILCSRCNRAIGWFDDNHERFIKAAAYLQKSKG